MKKWFSINNKADEAEILIYEEIGKDWFTGDGIAAKDFAEALKEIPANKPITVGINSPGGSVYDGIAIHSMLKARGNVTTRIDGVAASIASVIALAGKTVQMPKNALMMIHKAWSMAMGNADEMRKMADDLAKHDSVIAGIYTDKNGKSEAENLAAMEAETWFNGAEAKAFGLVDVVTTDAAFASVHDLTKFKNFKAAQASVPSQPNITLKSPAASTISAATVVATAGEIAPTNKPKENKTMETNTPVAVATAPAPVIGNTPVIAAINSLGDQIKAALTPAPGAAPLAPIIKKASANGDELWKEASEIKNLSERTQFVRNEIYANKGLKFTPMNANTLGGTEITRIAQMSLEALLTEMTPLSAFTTDFSDEAVAPGKVITTRYVTQPSTQDFSSSKAVADVTTTAKSVTLSSYKGVSLGFTDTERTYTDVQMSELFLRPAVTAIFEDVMAAAFALVLNATYSSSVTKTSAQLDADVVADLAGTLSTNKAPSSQRTLIISPAYFANLAKDSAIQAAYAYGGAEVIRENRAPRVHGFDVVSFNGTIPTNSENLTGIALHKSALLIASRRPVSPLPGTWYGQVGSATDPASGLTVDVRQHYDGTKQVLQLALLYGVSAGHGASLVRIKSA